MKLDYTFRDTGTTQNFRLSKLTCCSTTDNGPSWSASVITKSRADSKFYMAGEPLTYNGLDWA